MGTVSKYLIEMDSTVIAEALRMCRLENGPEKYELGLTPIQIGPVTLVGIPGEQFSGMGIESKDTNGWYMILQCALTNGTDSYFPTKSAYDEGD